MTNVILSQERGIILKLRMVVLLSVQKGNIGKKNKRGKELLVKFYIWDSLVGFPHRDNQVAVRNPDLKFLKYS